MSQAINLKSIQLLPLAKRYFSRYSRHTAFAAIMFALLVYVLVVFKINSLANAEPGPDQEQTVSTSIPRIDANAIKQIQSLENNNADIHSLFEQARNNPFQE